MERRAFVRLSAYTALALTVPFAEGCGRHKNDPLVVPYLFSHIVDTKHVREAGLDYRKMTANENSEAILSQLLSDNKQTMYPEALQSALEKQVKQDFISGKIVTVSGWVLSVTEARQCALFSIINS